MTGDAINLGLSIVEEIAGACVDDVTRVGIRAGFWGIRKAIGLVAGRGSPAVNLPEHPVERLLNELISDAKFQEARLVVLRLAAECGAPPDAVRGVMVQIDDAEQVFRVRHALIVEWNYEIARRVSSSDFKGAEAYVRSLPITHTMRGDILKKVWALKRKG